MRAPTTLRWILLLFLISAPTVHAQLAPGSPALAAFAEKSGLRDVAGFLETVQSLRRSGRLPPRYATKEAARAHGWHGGGLCSVWRGRTIGGDVFHDFGEGLPRKPGRVYREADLDADCRSRGPKRLIFSDDGLMYLTVDHYNSFTPVP